MTLKQSRSTITIKIFTDLKKSQKIMAFEGIPSTVCHDGFSAEVHVHYGKYWGNTSQKITGKKITELHNVRPALRV